MTLASPTPETIEAELAQIAAAMRADVPAEDLDTLIERRRAELGISSSANSWENRTATPGR